MITRWFGLVLGLLLAGCGSSPPTQYYALHPVPARTARPAIAGMPVQVAAVHIPPALDRQQLVQETAPGHLDVSDQNRWVGSLDDMIQRVLTQDLAQRLPASEVVLPQEPAPPQYRPIVLDILQFDEDGSGDVVFDGSWSLTDNTSGKPLLSRHTDARFRRSQRSVWRVSRRSQRPVAELFETARNEALEPHAHQIARLRRRRNAPRPAQRHFEGQRRTLREEDHREQLAPRLGRQRRDRLLEPPPLVAFEGGEIDGIGAEQGRRRQRLGRPRTLLADAEILHHRALVAAAPARGFGDGEGILDAKCLEHAAILIGSPGSVTALRAGA